MSAPLLLQVLEGLVEQLGGHEVRVQSALVSYLQLAILGDKSEGTSFHERSVQNSINKTFLQHKGI